jgi:hypothetical protein
VGTALNFAALQKSASCSDVTHITCVTCQNQAALHLELAEIRRNEANR